MATTSYPFITTYLEKQPNTRHALTYSHQKKAFSFFDDASEAIEDGMTLSERDIHDLADMFLTMSIHIKMLKGELEVLNTNI